MRFVKGKISERIEQRPPGVMARIILKNNEYSLYDFDNEADFEKAVIENQKYLFGKDSVYVDVKRRIGRDSHRGIPDAFLIDFYDTQKPQLYIVENEIASHDVYAHISEQIVRFGSSSATSANQIRGILIKAIENEQETKKGIERYLPQTVFKTVTELMLFLTENDIKIFEDGFKHAYLENNAWWEIRLSQEAREKLKYLAIYEKAPVAHISHYAEIERIEPYKDTGKYILYLKNKKTVKPIKLGAGKKGEAPQAPRYTTHSKLLNAKSVSELWR